MYQTFKAIDARRHFVAETLVGGKRNINFITMKGKKKWLFFFVNCFLRKDFVRNLTEKLTNLPWFCIFAKIAQLPYIF